MNWWSCDGGEYAESIVDTVREGLVVLDANLRVISANRSFYEAFKVKPGETEGQLLYDLGNRQWDIPKLRELLEEILPTDATFDNFQVEHRLAFERGSECRTQDKDSETEKGEKQNGRPSTLNQT